MEKILALMLRHGETLLNHAGKYRGQTNGPEVALDLRGITQAREAGVFLTKLDYNVKHIFCSPLHRTKDTCRIVCEIIGFPVDEVIQDKRLLPLDVGEYSGKDKLTNPVDEFLKDHSLKFPDGESVNDFDSRQHAFAQWFITQIEKGKIELESTLIIAHASNLAYWYNLHSPASNEMYLKEGTDVVGPGGLAAVTDEHFYPILNKGETHRQPDKDGTVLSGYVTFSENRPPRECWNCRYAQEGPIGYTCGHTLVRIDKQIPDFEARKQGDGRLLVGDRDCCDNFRNHPKT